MLVFVNLSKSETKTQKTCCWTLHFSLLATHNHQQLSPWSLSTSPLLSLVRDLGVDGGCRERQTQTKRVDRQNETDT